MEPAIVTFYGGAGSHELVLGQGVSTGQDVIVLGQGGNNTLAAGSGNATLVGGGDGDIIFGSQDGARQQLWASGDSSIYGGGSSSDTFFGFSGSNTSGKVNMSAYGSTGDNQFWAGAGNDTIWTGLGNDSVFVFADHTAGKDTAPRHLLENFGPNDTLFLNGYAAREFSTSPTGVVLSLSDGTQVTFAGITDPNAIKIVG